MIDPDLMKAEQKGDRAGINVLMFEHSHLFINYDEMELMIPDVNVLFENNTEDQFELPKYKEQLQQDLFRLEQTFKGIYEEWILFQNLSHNYQQIKEEHRLACNQFYISACT